MPNPGKQVWNNIHYSLNPEVPRNDDAIFPTKKLTFEEWWNSPKMQDGRHGASIELSKKIWKAAQENV